MSMMLCACERAQWDQQKQSLAELSELSRIAYMMKRGRISLQFGRNPLVTCN